MAIDVSEVGFVLDLMETADDWKRLVDVKVHIGTDLSLEETNVFRLNTSELRTQMQGQGTLYIPIEFSSPLDLGLVSVSVQTTDDCRQATPVSPHSLSAVIGDPESWTEKQRDLISQSLVVPILAHELLDNFPLVEVKIKSDIKLRILHRIGQRRYLSKLLPVGHRRMAITPANTGSFTMVNDPGIRLVSVVLDLSDVWLNSKAWGPIKGSAEQVTALRAQRNATTEAYKRAVEDMRETAFAALQVVLRTKLWWSKSTYKSIRWSESALDRIVSDLHDISLIDDSLATDIAQFRRYALQFESVTRRLESVKLPVATTLESPVQEVGLPDCRTQVEVAFTSEPNPDGPRRSWAMGTVSALLAMLAISIGILYATHTAQSMESWLGGRADAVVALLAITPIFILAQVEKADTWSTAAATYARRGALWVLLFPLAFPLLAALVIVQPEPNSGLLKAVLVSGVALSLVVTLARAVLFKESVLRRFAIAGYSAN